MEPKEVASMDDVEANVQTDRQARTPLLQTTLAGKNSDMDAVSNSSDLLPNGLGIQEGRDSAEVAPDGIRTVELTSPAAPDEKKSDVAGNSSHCSSEGTGDPAVDVPEKKPTPKKPTPNEPFSATAEQQMATKLDSFHQKAEDFVSTEVASHQQLSDTKHGAVGGVSAPNTSESAPAPVPTENLIDNGNKLVDNPTVGPSEQPASAQVAAVAGDTQSDPIAPAASAVPLDVEPSVCHLSAATPRRYVVSRKHYVPEFLPQRPLRPLPAQFTDELQQELFRRYGREVPIDVRFTGAALLAAREFLVNTVTPRTGLPPALLFQKLAPRVVTLVLSQRRRSQYGVWDDDIVTVTDDCIQRAAALINEDERNYQVASSVAVDPNADTSTPPAHAHNCRLCRRPGCYCSKAHLTEPQEASYRIRPDCSQDNPFEAERTRNTKQAIEQQHRFSEQKADEVEAGVSLPLRFLVVQFIGELQRELFHRVGLEVRIDARFTDAALMAARELLVNTVAPRTRLSREFLLEQLAPRVVALALSLRKSTQTIVYANDPVTVTDDCIGRAVRLIDEDRTNYEDAATSFTSASYQQAEEYTCHHCKHSFRRSRQHALMFLAKSQHCKLAQINGVVFLVDLRCTRCTTVVATLHFTHVERAVFFRSLHGQSVSAFAGHVC